MANVIHTGKHTQLIDQSFEDSFFDEYTTREPEFSQIFKMKTHDEHDLTMGEMGGFDQALQYKEGEPMPMGTTVEGNDKTITFPQYGLQFQVTEIMREDDLFGKISQLGGMLGKAMDKTREILAWDLLNSAFSSSVRTGIDGNELCASDHSTLVTSETIDNLGTAGLITQSSLEEGFNYFETLKDEEGFPMMMVPRYLVVKAGSDNHWRAREYVKSEYKVGTADNDLNIINADYGLTVVPVHWLTSSTAWFMLAEDHDLCWYTRRPIQTRSWDDPATGNRMEGANYRVKATFFKYRGVFGNAGA